jgi:hypothetical protein
MLDLKKSPNPSCCFMNAALEIRKAPHSHLEILEAELCGTDELVRGIVLVKHFHLNRKPEI